MADEESDKKAKPEAAAAPAAAGAGKNKLLLPLLGVNSLMLVAVLAALLVRPASKAEPAGEKGEAHGGHATEKSKDVKGKDGKHELPGPTMKLGDFVVHLRDLDTDRYARMSFEVEFADEHAKEAVTGRMPRIRDVFLAYLADRSAEDLKGSEGLTKVKGALAERLGEIVPGGSVRALYLTEMVVQ